jgi:hypothetical protein
MLIVGEGTQVKRLYADHTLFESLRGFVSAESIQIELTEGDGPGVKVLLWDDRKESDLDTLYSGGWIGCRTALSLAKKLEIPKNQLGALLNHLRIKVKNCSLGCF